ncbi:MAG: LacI family DNA-binding transcriptional regulator [Microbacterium sp.]
MTAKDIANSLGLSRATVGFVLNNTPGQTISEATRRRVIAEASRLGYRPHSAARALASGRTNTVLLMLPDWPIDFTMRNNIEEASQVLDEAGYALIFSTPHESGKARPLWETLEPDAVISYLPFEPETVKAMRDAGVTRLIPDPDNAATEISEPGIELQVDYLAQLGHRKLAYAGPTDLRLAQLSENRWSVARNSSAERECTVNSVAIDFHDNSATLAVELWLQEYVTGVLCYNDEVAAAVVGAALRLGVSIPDQLSIIGHDDAPIAALYQPRLSTIRLDTAGLGRYLAELTIATIEDRPAGEPHPLSSSVELIVRETTAPPSIRR